jgi:hypothetical protein
LRNGARALLTQAVETEVADFLGRYADLKTEAGHQRVVRHGHLPEREIMTGMALGMTFKLAQSAETSWNRVRGYNQLPKIIIGVKFNDGIEVVPSLILMISRSEGERVAGRARHSPLMLAALMMGHHFSDFGLLKRGKCLQRLLRGNTSCPVIILNNSPSTWGELPAPRRRPTGGIDQNRHLY